jgi:hypothetical protein
MLKRSTIRDAHQAVMQVLDPETGKPTGATITLMSPEHPRAKQEAAGFERRRRQEARSRGGRPVDDPEAEMARLFERLTFMTLDWAGFVDDAGAPLECSAEQVRSWYEGVAWLRNQVLRFIADQANFIERSASSSSSTPAPISA